MTIAIINAVLADAAWRADFERRLWAKIDKSGGVDACWMWTAKAKHVFGYGVICAKFKRGTVTGHVASWALTNGPIPTGAFVLHKCDVPGCCNPKHLFLGDAQANMADKVSKGRQSHVVHTEESIAKIKAGRAANPPKMTESGLAARRAATRKMWQNPEWRARFSALMSGPNNPRYGKRPPEHQLEAVRRNHRSKSGYRHSEETKARIRAALRKRYEKADDNSHP